MDPKILHPLPKSSTTKDKGCLAAKKWILKKIDPEERIFVRMSRKNE